VLAAVRGTPGGVGGEEARPMTLLGEDARDVLPSRFVTPAHLVVGEPAVRQRQVGAAARRRQLEGHARFLDSPRSRPLDAGDPMRDAPAVAGLGGGAAGARPIRWCAPSSISSCSRTRAPTARTCARSTW